MYDSEFRRLCWPAQKLAYPSQSSMFPPEVQERSRTEEEQRVFLDERRTEHKQKQSSYGDAHKNEIILG
jgi:hypothetical protein